MIDSKSKNYDNMIGITIKTYHKLKPLKTK